MLFRSRWEKGLSARVDPVSVPEGPARELFGETLYRVAVATDKPVAKGTLTFSFNPLRTFG